MIPLKPRGYYTTLETKSFEYDESSPGYTFSGAELTYWVNADNHNVALPHSHWLFSGNIWETYHNLETARNFGSIDAASGTWDFEGSLEVLDADGNALHEITETVTIDQYFERHVSVDTTWTRVLGGDGLLYVGPINGVRWTATWNPFNTGGVTPDYNFAFTAPLMTYPWRCVVQPVSNGS